MGVRERLLEWMFEMTIFLTVFCISLVGVVFALGITVSFIMDIIKIIRGG